VSKHFRLIMKRLFTNSILAASSLLLSVASYGQTPITSVPFTISSGGLYVVTAQLVYSASTGNAITVNANNVIIDLNGHYLICSVSGNSATGIFADNKLNIRVRNGEILKFFHGVGFDFSSGTNNNIGHVVESIGFWNNNIGVWFHQTKASVVRNCIFNGGLAGIDFFAGTGNRAVGNVATGISFGFFSDGTDYFDSNYADNCGTGIDATSATTKLRFNTTTNCTTGVTGGTSEFANDL
jgi:hypothetical protein